MASLLALTIMTQNKPLNVGLVDYGAGNLHSVQNAFSKQGIASQLVRQPADLSGLQALVLPGVGAYGDCAKQLHAQDLWSPLQDWLAANKPYFGICLGYQILFEHSVEFEVTPGLGVLSGRVVQFPIIDLKVPHMGWNSLTLTDHNDPVWEGLPEDPYVYFVHSYYPQPTDESVVSAWCDYGFRFAAAVRQGNLFATQFHPEKSQGIGLRLLKNFVLHASSNLAES